MKIEIELTEHEQKLLRICGGDAERALKHGLRLAAMRISDQRLESARKDSEAVHSGIVSREAA